MESTLIKEEKYSKEFNDTKSMHKLLTHKNYGSVGKNKIHNLPWEKKKKEKGTHSKGKKRNVHIYKTEMYMVKVGMGDVMAREAGQQETTEK